MGWLVTFSLQPKEERVVPSKHKFEVRRERHGIEGEDGLDRVVHIANIHELPGTLPVPVAFPTLKS